MAWDERGRLWIAETRDYPNNRQPAGQGNDEATVFADRLTIVSSLVYRVTMRGVLRVE